MEFREGMLGVVIVALALVAALGASYFAGVEPTEVQVTKYQYLADVSGLFDYDRSPQYIEFDPSSNYVGFYSKDTGEYWPVKDVGYEKNPNVNNYKVNLEPIILSQRTTELGDYKDGVTHPFDVPFERITFDNVARKYVTTIDVNDRPEIVNLKSYVAVLELDESTSTLEIRSLGTYSESDEGSTYHANWINFSTESMWDVTSSTAELRLASEGWFSHNGYTAPHRYVNPLGEYLWTYYLPCLSCSIDLNTGITTLYYDKDCTEIFTTTSIENVIMMYGGSPGLTETYIDFDERARINEVRIDKEYLNPNYGVTMKPLDPVVSDAFKVSTIAGRGGTVTGSGNYALGDDVILTATPDVGYRFVNWTFTGGTSMANPYTTTVQEPMLGQSVTFTANFEEIPHLSITVNAGPGGSASGSGNYELGDEVTLIATPSAGYRFDRWTFNGGSSLVNPYTLIIQAPMLGQSVTYIASFVEE